MTGRFLLKINTSIFLLFWLFISVQSQIISTDSIKQHLNFLADDACQGRAPGTDGEKLAAEYIMHQLKKYRLTPIGENKSFFQNVPMHGSYPLPQTDLKLYQNNTIHSLKLNDDYLLYKTGASTFIPTPLPLVFVGYGIIAPEYDYNDYQDIDVEGKIVVFLSGEPLSDNPEYFKGQQKTIYSSPDTKQRIAISRGASGSILLLNPLEQFNQDWDFWARQFQFEDVSLTYSVSTNLSILLNPEIAELLFKNEPIDFDNILNLHSMKRMTSFRLNSSISIKSFYNERDFVSKNIVGLLEGNDSKLKDSYLIISAHYDHLGIGPAVDGDSIYNGAFDNAAGVSVLLELARNLKREQKKINRSIIFIFTTGEEKGLLGATYYTDHPLRPLYKTIANVNIDGISSFDQTHDFVGIGLEESDIGKYLAEVFRGRSLQLFDSPDYFVQETESVNRSDHFAFAKAGIPFLIVLEGLNYFNIKKENSVKIQYDWHKNIYHSPFDDLNQDINFNAMNQHATVLYDLIKIMANEADPPQWNEDSPFLLQRLQSIAEKR